MANRQHHVLPNPQGGWDVKRSGSDRASIHAATKEEAVKVGRVFSQRAGSDLVIHGRDGQIQRSDSHR